MRVAVIGAGIIGATSAVAVKNAFPRFEVHVFADEFSPDTTGDGSAGLWNPFLLGPYTPPEKILQWGGATHRWLENLWKTGLASETGVSFLPVYRFVSDPNGYTDFAWTKLVHGAHRLGKTELDRFNKEHRRSYKDGWMFLTYTGEPARLLPWLTKKFLGAGGKLVKRKITAMQELVDLGYDFVINCSGLGARRLANDDTVIPIRGQVARVKAPWAMHGYLEDDDPGNYVIPNIDSTILGGTHQENDFDRTPRKDDSTFIFDGCCEILPALKGASVMKEWVGLRPGRPKVRLEAEVFRSPKGKEITVIHNYGHGGSGVTLSWGCALDVVNVLRSRATLKSNL